MYTREISPFALGATLYMPVIRPDIIDIILHGKIPGLKSIVLCLEDALAENDVESGLINLHRVLETLAMSDRNRDQEPVVFVRPRHLSMATFISMLPHIDQVDGFVVPKATAHNISGWFEIVEHTGLYLMPTLETAEMFDPYELRKFRTQLQELDASRILALRIGGNDLMSCIGVRRQRGMTLYDGPIGHVIPQMVGLFVPHGFALTAPVHEIMDDEKSLRDELVRDVAHGLVGKTAIHPCQIDTINSAFSVSLEDLQCAQHILRDNAPAVFKMNGAMAEPKTHTTWAKNIINRMYHYGVTTPVTQNIEQSQEPIIDLTLLMRGHREPVQKLDNMLAL